MCVGHIDEFVISSSEKIWVMVDIIELHVCNCS